MDTKTGYIKLPRSILDGEIASKPHTLAILVHLLVKANREAKIWHGVRIDRGQFVTSRRSLSKSCGLSEHQVRTALQLLTRHGIAQVHSQVHSQPEPGGAAHLAAQGYTIITICDYDSYDGPTSTNIPSSIPSKKAAASQLPAQKAATTKENRSISIDIESIIDIPDFRPIVLDWMEYKRERGQAFKGRMGIIRLYNRLRQLSGGNPSLARQFADDSMAANAAQVYTTYTEKMAHPRPTPASVTSRLFVPEYDSNNFKSTL